MDRVDRSRFRILVDDEWMIYSGDIWELAEFIHDNYITISREVWNIFNTTAKYPFDELPYEKQRVMLELAYRIIKKEHDVE